MPPAPVVPFFGGRCWGRITNCGYRIRPLSTHNQSHQPPHFSFRPAPLVPLTTPATQHRYTPGFPMCLTGGAANAAKTTGRASPSSGGVGATPAWVHAAPIDVIVASSEIPVREEEPAPAQGRVSRQPKSGSKSGSPIFPLSQYKRIARWQLSNREGELTTEPRYPNAPPLSRNTHI